MNDDADLENIERISYTSPHYPKKLLEACGFPSELYVQGQLPLESEKCIAIVGTRQASIYGLEMAYRIAKDLAAGGFVVVSGLARGIDTAAHAGALEGGKTIAVIGSGHSNLYPKENRRLAEKICEKGAVISEFSPQTPPARHNFPKRNRIVSGMSLGVLLIEAPIKSGAMITMDLAGKLGRKTFAIPGRVDFETFQGNHLLIKEGKAVLIESASDIFKAFNEKQCAATAKKNACFLEKDEELFLKMWPSHEVSLDEILKVSDLSVMKVNVLLMKLLLKSAIKEYPGKIYKKNSE